MGSRKAGIRQRALGSGNRSISDLPTCRPAYLPPYESRFLRNLVKLPCRPIGRGNNLNGVPARDNGKAGGIDPARVAMEGELIQHNVPQ